MEEWRTDFAALTRAGVHVQFEIRILAFSIALTLTSVGVQVEARSTLLIALTTTSVRIKIEPRWALSITIARTSFRI